MATEGLELAEHGDGQAERTIGRLKGFHGQMGMFVRALAYMMSHGADGCAKLPRMRCSTPTTCARSWKMI